jgi:hypothetical protein
VNKGICLVNEVLVVLAVLGPVGDTHDYQGERPLFSSQLPSSSRYYERRLLLHNLIKGLRLREQITQEPRYFVSYDWTESRNLRVVEESMEGSARVTPFGVVLLHNERPLSASPET